MDNNKVLQAGVEKTVEFCEPIELFGLRYTLIIAIKK